VDSLTHQPLYAGIEPRYPLDGRQGGPQSRSVRDDEGKNSPLCPCQESNLGRPARHLVTELLRAPRIQTKVNQKEINKNWNKRGKRNKIQNGQGNKWWRKKPDMQIGWLHRWVHADVLAAVIKQPTTRSYLTSCQNRRLWRKQDPCNLLRKSTQLASEIAYEAVNSRTLPPVVIMIWSGQSEIARISPEEVPQISRPTP
jgi:hypothetical protein